MTDKAPTPAPKPLTQPARRSLPPPPPSAVRAAKQQSLLPPPSPSIDVHIDIGDDDDDDDATVVRDKSAFAGFFDAEDDDAENEAPLQKTRSPWALPSVAPIQTPRISPPRVSTNPPPPPPRASTPPPPILQAPPPPIFETGSSDDEAQTEELLPKAPDVQSSPSASEWNDATADANSDVEAAEMLDDDEAPPKDDLDALFGRAKTFSENDRTLPRNSVPFASGSRAAPPPPPSLRPPPPSSGLKPPPPPLAVSDEPTLTKSSAPPPPPLAAGNVVAIDIPPPPNFVTGGNALTAAPLPPVPNLPPVSSLPPIAAAPLPPPPVPSLPQPPGISSTAGISVPLGRSLPPPVPPPPRQSSLVPSHVSQQNFDNNDVGPAHEATARPLPSFTPHASVPPSFAAPTTALPTWLSRKRLIGLGIAAGILGLSFFVLRPTQGQLVVTVAGPNGTTVDGIKVFMDDNLVCSSSPCRVNDVEAKSYFISVEAEGFARTAAAAVSIKAGEDSVHNVQLQAPIITSPTGVEISATGPGFNLFVDGRAMGNLPQKLNLEPGEHTLKISGGERYVDEERKITLREGQLLTLDAIQLPVKLGRATIQAGNNADAAQVLLNGTPIQLPHTTDLPGDKKHTLVATRDGFTKFEKEVSFAPGKAEATFVIALEGTESDGEATASASKSKGGAGSHKAKAGAAKAGAEKAGASGGTGTLNINSIPSANVLLNGKPIGKTPKLGVKVPAGTHTITFVSDKGRKRMSANVKPGGKQTVSVRF